MGVLPGHLSERLRFVHWYSDIPYIVGGDSSSLCSVCEATRRETVITSTTREAIAGGRR